MNKNASILFFSLNPEQEAGRKRWSESKKINIRIAQSLYSETLSKVKDSKLEYYTNTKQDSNNNFAANITSTIQQLFDQGIESLIVIGNDCPDINTQDLLKANQDLQQGKHSFGQTKDGGAFLFTIGKDNWDAAQFEKLSWCTNELGNELYDYLSANSPVVKLVVKTDLNFLKDIEHFINHSKSLIRVLFKGLFSKQTTLYKYCIIDQSTIAQTQLRGPPKFHI